MNNFTNFVKYTAVFFTCFFAFAQSPTSPAQGFNLFVQENATLTTNETDGPVAIGGNLILNGNYQVATNSAGNFMVQGVRVGLLVGGRVQYQSGNALQVNQNAYVKIGDPTGSVVWYKDQNNAPSPIRITNGSNYNSNPRIMLQATAPLLGVSAINNPVFESGLVDFNAAFSQMRNKSLSIAECTHNAQLTNANGQPVSVNALPNQVKINLQEGVNYLNITGQQLNQVQVFTFNNQPSAQRVLVVNVDAPGTFNWTVWNQAGVALQHCPFIMYNFPHTENLNIVGNSTIEGTVFAPKAAVVKTVNQSNIEGQVIAKSFSMSGGEIHYAIFTPELQGCAVPPPPLVTGTAPTADYAASKTTVCKNEVIEFTNQSSVIACPTPYFATTHATVQEAEGSFNHLYFSAEGRSGNNALNGTFEIDIHNVNPYQILQERQFVWPNGQAVPFTVVYDPNASGNNKFVYTVGTGAQQQILKLDPVAAGYPLNLNGIWFYSRTAPNTTLMVNDLVINGTAYGSNLGFTNPAVASFVNTIFRSPDFVNGFTISGNVTFAWTGSIPQNSALNFNFKIGNIDCIPATIAQPDHPLSYEWDFGDATSSTDMNPTKSYSQAGTYTVTLTTTNTFGTSTATKTITVNAPILATTNATVLSSGNGAVNYQFAVTNDTHFSLIEWTLPDATVSSGTTATFSFTQAGYYPILVTTTDINGCVSSQTIWVTISSESVNTGNDGGIESESLGDALSKMMLQRKKNDIPTVFAYNDNIKFSKTKLVSNQLMRSGGLTMLQLFPSELTTGDQSFVTSPTDIINFTIAEEVLSVDFRVQGSTQGVVLGIRTSNRVYNHTKASCDRLRGAEILHVRDVNIGGYPFLMQAIRQANGVIEYAVSFALGVPNNQPYFTLQGGWYVNHYQPTHEVFNFQVWSTKPEHTFKLVNDILSNTLDVRPIQVLDMPVIPQTYVSKVWRQDVDLFLKLHSIKENEPIEIECEEVRSETHGFGYRYVAANSEKSQIVSMKVHDFYEYDGLVKVREQIVDAFYHSDGNWGLDYVAADTQIQQYMIANQVDREFNEDEHIVHRNVILDAQTSDYITLYKALQPGNTTIDLTEYQFLSFKATGSGVMELGLIKNSIQNWNQQYKANVNIRESEHTYYVPYRFFASTGTRDRITANDLTQITFTFSPALAQTQQLNLRLSDVKFTKTAPAGFEDLLHRLGDQMLVYPNPSQGNVKCLVYASQQTTATLEIRSLTGMLLYTSQVPVVEGRNELSFDFDARVKSSKMVFLTLSTPQNNYGTVKLMFD